MVSGTNIKKVRDDGVLPFGIPAPEKGRAPGLTLRILAVNVIAPMLLVLGLLYLGKYQESLIRTEMETLESQTRLFATAVSEASSYKQITPSLDAQEMQAFIKRLGTSIDHRVMIFSDAGAFLGETITPEQFEDKLHDQKISDLALITRTVGHALLALLPTHTPLHNFPGHKGLTADDYPAAILALKGETLSLPWEAHNKDIILTAATPIYLGDQLQGVIHMTAGGFDIEQAMAQVRFDVFTVFLGALSLTIFVSIYLAGFIGRPLKKLAVAAEAVRVGKGREIFIPDMSHRRDEIGDLSLALREMTQALWDRMDTIERFAADVAHEIKNPLTSLRSAVETVEKVKSASDRKKLMEIIHNDVQRLDRLISDISNASRLDAELSRDELGPVDIGQLLHQLIQDREKSIERLAVTSSVPKFEFDIPSSDDGEGIMVQGNESRLAQVFENLLSNAQSFSPADGTVKVSVEKAKKHVGIYVEDHGPGIPENKLESIFERFYTERPVDEQGDNMFGAHSGLGLSISKQIIDALGGSIYAENVYDSDDNVTGARFTVILDHA